MFGACKVCISKVPKNNPRLLHSTDWTGIAQNSNYTRDILHTRQHGQHRPREFKFKFNSTLYVSAHGVTFMHVLIEELYAPLCITVSYQQHSFIYMWLFPHICHFTLSSRKFIGSAKKQQYPQTHAVYSSIYFNKLFRFADALLFVLVFNSQI